MNCKDFSELADSYLSDELAVESNHEIFAHLESCAACRNELSVRREIREKARGAMRLDGEFGIDPVFAGRLRARLADSAARDAGWLGWRSAGLAFASMLVVAVVGFALFGSFGNPSDGLRAYLVEKSRQAAGDHHYCALDKIARWESNAGKVQPEKAAFVRPIEQPDTEVLEVHDCVFEGVVFRHYILRRGKAIISVQQIPDEGKSGIGADNAILSERESGVQVASFRNRGQLVFVVSDLSESENLGMARILSDSVKSPV